MQPGLQITHKKNCEAKIISRKIAKRKINFFCEAKIFFILRKIARDCEIAIFSKLQKSRIGKAKSFKKLRSEAIFILCFAIFRNRANSQCEFGALVRGAVSIILLLESIFFCFEIKLPSQRRNSYLMANF